MEGVEVRARDEGGALLVEQNVGCAWSIDDDYGSVANVNLEYLRRPHRKTKVHSVSRCTQRYGMVSVDCRTSPYVLAACRKCSAQLSPRSNQDPKMGQPRGPGRSMLRSPGRIILTNRADMAIAESAMSAFEMGTSGMVEACLVTSKLVAGSLILRQSLVFRKGPPSRDHSCFL